MYEKLIPILLSMCLFLTGCGSAIAQEQIGDKAASEAIRTEESENLGLESSEVKEQDSEGMSFNGLDDSDLLVYVENNIYSEVIDELNDQYFVENVNAVYLSQEYINDSTYNSQSNVFFGYSLDELEEQFQGNRYVFTLGDDGQTTAVELEEVYDDTYDQVIKNVAIGGGVILICVTVSAVTAANAPAVSAIFAASASTGTVFALESGALGFITASIAKGYQTQDFEQAIKAGTLSASEGFKWGAIIGGVSGGVKEGLALKGATLNGLTMNEAAEIQRDSKWPIEAIKAIHSMSEYDVYKKAELIPTQLNENTWAFVREINWEIVDEFGRTNAERILDHVAPIDATGMPYELHHIGQKADSPLAILTYAEHHLEGNYKILHYADEGKDVTDAVWKAQKKEFWNAILELAQKG